MGVDCAELVKSGGLKKAKLGDLKEYLKNFKQPQVSVERGCHGFECVVFFRGGGGEVWGLWKEKEDDPDPEPVLAGRREGGFNAASRAPRQVSVQQNSLLPEVWRESFKDTNRAAC